jgi:hypothetical protein
MALCSTLDEGGTQDQAGATVFQSNYQFALSALGSPMPLLAAADGSQRQRRQQRVDPCIVTVAFDAHAIMLSFAIGRVSIWR